MTVEPFTAALRCFRPGILRFAAKEQIPLAAPGVGDGELYQPFRRRDLPKGKIRTGGSLHRVLRAVQPVMEKIADLLPGAAGKGHWYRHGLSLPVGGDEAEDGKGSHMGTAFFIGLEAADSAVPGLQEKSLVQCCAFGKLQSDGRFFADQRPGRIAQTTKAGNFSIPYELQALLKGGCGKPGLQLDCFQHRKMHGDFLILEVIHSAVESGWIFVFHFRHFLPMEGTGRFSLAIVQPHPEKRDQYCRRGGFCMIEKKDRG